MTLNYSYWNEEETMHLRGSMEKELTQYTNCLDKGLLEGKGRDKDGSEGKNGSEPSREYD